MAVAGQATGRQSGTLIRCIGPPHSAREQSVWQRALMIDWTTLPNNVRRSYTMAKQPRISLQPTTTAWAATSIPLLPLTQLDLRCMSLVEVV